MLQTSEVIKANSCLTALTLHWKQYTLLLPLWHFNSWCMSLTFDLAIETLQNVVFGGQTICYSMWFILKWFSRNSWNLTESNAVSIYIIAIIYSRHNILFCQHSFHTSFRVSVSPYLVMQEIITLFNIMFR